jgi:HAD superfamily hydrolase (TIGR01509 family)
MKDNIIFDLDGTLIDSMDIWDNIGRDFLKSNGVNVPDDLEKTLETMSFEEGAQYFNKVLGVDMSPKEIIGAIVAMVKDKYIYDVPLKKGVYEYLHKMKTEGKNMCILTASEEDYVIPALKRLGIYDCFSSVLTCTGLGMSKSGSDIYNVAAKKCGFEKENTAVFEDALHGVVNAKKAGFYVVGVYDSHEEKNRSQIEEVADIYIKDFEHLIK